MNKNQTIERELLSKAGIGTIGKKPWDMKIHDPRTLTRILREASLGLGESYMDGWWDCDQLDEFFYRILNTKLDEIVKNNWPLLWLTISSKFFNQQTIRKSRKVGEIHYDVGNDLYQIMLGPSMAYSCGYWSGQKPAKNLQEAQEAKFDLICRKLGLKKGMALLDIGCGWGTLMKYAVEHYGVTATGITISKEQAAFAKKLCKGLPIEVKLQDYRDTKGEFDRIVSVGMLEHVGYKNYRIYMQTAHRLLKPGGLFLLHTIGQEKSTTTTEPWIDKYIFPNSQLPSIAQVGTAIEDFFVMEDWHNFGADYDKTLMAWHHNFEKAWPKLKKNYDERFRRMWNYYLLSCAASFRVRRTELWQIVLAKGGVAGGWKTVR